MLAEMTRAVDQSPKGPQQARWSAGLEAKPA